MRNRDSSVSIVLRLRAGRLRNCVSILRRSIAFSFLRNLQTETEAHTGSYTMGKWGIFVRRLIGRGVKLTTHLHLALRLRLYKAIPPFAKTFLTLTWIPLLSCNLSWKLYRGADKSLARSGRKQATATEDFEFHITSLFS
jgi:hypothetical protein